jgi:hypothetical protein
LEIGSEAKPIAAAATAEVVIADQPLDLQADPDQFGTGLIGMGTITMHGAIKSPTFVRLTSDPKIGATALDLEQPVTGWRSGDNVVLPDTRQLRSGEIGTARLRVEELHLRSVNSRTANLDESLAFDHPGPVLMGGAPATFFPHVGNITRNVIIRSENPAGTRGHVIFVGRATVDIRYVLFKDLGRTRMGVLDNTVYADSGEVSHVGTNQIGRYSLHFHHVFGPTKAPANGYQYTLIGNVIDDGSKWGITIHNTHYGLVRDNVVYRARGSGIVGEDGTESFNTFDHNFVVGSAGSGEFAPASGYAGAGNDPGGEGSGFWLRGPNNIIRNNVVASTDTFGYAIAAGALGDVRIPSFKGADTSHDGDYTVVDTTAMPILEFTSNEAYGVMKSGIAVGWNATLTNSVVWNVTKQAISALPTDRLVIDGLTVRGDPSVLAAPFENPTGIWFGNFVGKSIIVRNVDIRGMRVGVMSPFFATAGSEPGRGTGLALIENSRFQDCVGIAVATSYTDLGSSTRLKKVVVKGSTFVPLEATTTGPYPCAAISMNFGTSAGDMRPRDPILAFDFDKSVGDSFEVFYSRGLSSVAQTPNVKCTDRTHIDGFTCNVEGLAGIANTWLEIDRASSVARASLLPGN